MEGGTEPNDDVNLHGTIGKQEDFFMNVWILSINGMICWVNFYKVLLAGSYQLEKLRENWSLCVLEYAYFLSEIVYKYKSDT